MAIDPAPKNEKKTGLCSKIVYSLIATVFVCYATNRIILHFDSENIRAPGYFVEVDGAKMHVVCEGPDSKDALILIPGLGCPFHPLFHILKQTSREANILTCIVDRFGLGWSDQPPKNNSHRHLKQMVPEIHQAIKGSENLKGKKLIIGGHSLGGELTQVYAQMYPENIIGIILLDSASESIPAGGKLSSTFNNIFAPASAFFVGIGELGIERIFWNFGLHSPTERWRHNLDQNLIKNLNYLVARSPSTRKVALEEIAAIDTICNQTKEFPISNLIGKIEIRAINGVSFFKPEDGFAEVDDEWAASLKFLESSLASAPKSRLITYPNYDHLDVLYHCGKDVVDFVQEIRNGEQ